MADITMPQLGETVTEGTITKWMKQVGDRVEEDEVLYEVSTDKVDSEVPSATAGWITEILVPEGETAPVGAKLAVLSDAEPGAGGGAAAPAAAADAPAPAAEETAPAAPDAGAPSTDEPEQQAAAAEQAGQPETARPAQPTGSDAPAPAVASAPAPAGPAPSSNGSSGGAGKVLSPVVRKLISEHNLDPAAISGSGAGGRITRADVHAYIDSGAAKSAPAAAAPAPAASAPAAAAPAAAAAPTAPISIARAGERDTVVPFSNIRKRTAEHMVRSLATSAHTLVVIEIDYQNIDKVRAKYKDKFKAEEGVSLSYLPFIARAAVDAIREFPHVNATVGDNELIVHNYVNLGIAVDLNYEGLIVPVVHDADGKRMRAIAREIGDLAGRARNRKLAADDISGGTFTITNAGGYGTLITGPVINQPQVAILSTDGVKPKPVAVPLPNGEYAIVVHPVGNLAISFDHRAYDGAYASAFLAKIKEIMETRDWTQEL